MGFAIYVDLLQELQGGEDFLGVDTLILHDGTVDALTLAAAAEEAARQGSVLVAKQLPEGRTYKRIIRFEKGESVIC